MYDYEKKEVKKMYFTKDYRQLDAVALHLMYNKDKKQYKTAYSFKQWLNKSLLIGNIKRL